MGEIDRRVSENGLTPVVVLDFINETLTKREAYLASLNQLSSSLGAVGVSPASVPAGTAEIGLTLPRSLFDNRVDGFVAELRRLDLVFRFFGEVTTGQAEHATLGEISSTDPSIFFGLPPHTILEISKAFKWAVDQLATLAKLGETIESLSRGLKKARSK